AGAIGGLAGNALKNGVPVAIGGTTANPTFTPNLQGALSSGTKGLAGDNQSTGANKKSTTDSLTNALGGLLNRHK
ncbi:MAG TPA: hypothetical protein VK593_00275, partial [Edaphobacter sp.]|nr:hypothetical protein [Edaphobacter sp.]